MPISTARRAFVASMALSLCACTTGGPDLFTPAPHPSADFPNIRYANWTSYEPPYRLYPGDEVDLTVPSAPELNKTLTVQPDGRLYLALAGSVEVADRTLGQAEAVVSRAYASQLIRPDVSLSVKAATLKVFVGGEVSKPGIYDMPGDINALQAVILAGGFTPIAKRSEVVIIRRGPDGAAMLRTADLRQGLADATVDLVPLRRFDIVYVPRTRVAEAGLFVQQYFKDLTPVDLGFQYTRGPAFVTGILR